MTPFLPAINLWHRQSRLFLAVILVSIGGCTRICGVNRAELTPEQIVEMYLDTALNMTKVEQRANLMQFTTGGLKAAIAGVSDETIRAIYINRKYEIISYAVVERRDRTPRETEITFQLKYRDLGVNAGTSKSADDEHATVTTENSVSVVREEGAWFIRDVIGQKTALDFPVSESSRIEVRPGDNSAGTVEESDLDEEAFEAAPVDDGQALPK